MITSLIVAVAENNAIGKDNNLLWHLPADMKFFREKTMGHCVITGRKNYESIPEKFRPLPGRTNIVLTRDQQYPGEGIVLKSSLEEAIRYAQDKGEEELFIIGGGQIYKEAINKKLADRIYLTKVKVNPDADTFFHWQEEDWVLTSEEYYKADEKNKFDMIFCVYQRK